MSGETEAQSPATPAPIEGDVLGVDGEPIGGLLLLAREGHLVSFEVYSYDDEPLQMPAPDRVCWVVR